MESQYWRKKPIQVGHRPFFCKIEKLCEYYRNQRWNDFLNNAPVKDLERARRYNSLIRKILMIDLFFVGQKTKVFKNNSQLCHEPTIYACTHIGRYDAEQLLLTIEKQAHVMFGDPGKIYRTINGILLGINGVIYVELDNKNDRIASKATAIKLLQQGGNLLIFPEGAWNITENEPCMKLYTGVIEMAIIAGCDIVPIAMEEYDKTYVINIGENISFQGKCIEEKRVLADELRDALCTLRWEIWEEKGRKGNIQTEKNP